jgi:hypothetical protein
MTLVHRMAIKNWNDVNRRCANKTNVNVENEMNEVDIDLKEIERDNERLCSIDILERKRESDFQKQKDEVERRKQLEIERQFERQRQIEQQKEDERRKICEQREVNHYLLTTTTIKNNMIIIFEKEKHTWRKTSTVECV